VVRQVYSPGSVARDKRGRIYSSQLNQANEISEIQAGEDELVLSFSISEVKRPFPSALDFVILRLLSLTVLKSLSLGNLVKKCLVYLLISRRPRSVGSVTRRVKLGENFALEDSIQSNLDLSEVTEVQQFSAIHMASQGYWQRNDGVEAKPER